MVPSLFLHVYSSYSPLPSPAQNIAQFFFPGFYNCTYSSTSSSAHIAYRLFRFHRYQQKQDVQHRANRTDMTMKAVSTVPSGIDAGVGLVVALYWLAILLPLVIFDSAALLAKVTVEERRNKHSDVPLMSTTIDTIKQYASLVCRSGKRGQVRCRRISSSAVLLSSIESNVHLQPATAQCASGYLMPEFTSTKLFHGSWGSGG